MTASNDLSRRSASELARLIATRAASPVEVLQAHLDTIARVNPHVNAVCTLVADQAMDAARQAERSVMAGEALGALAGIPVGIKDVTPTAGILTTYGSPLMADNVPDEDAAVVRRLRTAGAIVIGKTNTPEFAAGANTVNRLFGATRNPWDLDKSVGGSTGGGGAALASGMIALAEGTDFGGSLRVPAAFCGMVGLRPTAGLIPSHPVPNPWDFGRVHGPMARTAEDVALMLDAVAGVSDLSPISSPAPWPSARAAMSALPDANGLKLVYSRDIAGVGVDPEVEALCRAAARSLADAGASVIETEFSLADGAEAYQALRGLWMVGQYFDHLHEMDKFGANLKGNVERGLALTVRDLAGAEHKRAELWHRCRKLFAGADLLLTPTTPVPPFPVVQNYPETIAGRKTATYIDWIAPTFLVTLCGLPAVSVSCGRTTGGLPVGLQIIGPRFCEPRLLATAKLVQDAHPLGWSPLLDTMQ
jgi:amidase